MNERYFFDQDHLGHWYLIPEANRAEWKKFLYGSVTPRPDTPTFAKRLVGHPNTVNFVSPAEVEKAVPLSRTRDAGVEMSDDIMDRRCAWHCEWHCWCVYPHQFDPDLKRCNVCQMERPSEKQ